MTQLRDQMFRQARLGCTTCLYSRPDVSGMEQMRMCVESPDSSARFSDFCCSKGRWCIEGELYDYIAAVRRLGIPAEKILTIYAKEA